MKDFILHHLSALSSAFYFLFQSRVFLSCPKIEINIRVDVERETKCNLLPELGGKATSRSFLSNCRGGLVVNGQLHDTGESPHKTPPLVGQQTVSCDRTDMQA